MKKMFILLSLALLCASVAVAQDASTAGQAATPTTTTSAKVSPVQGCLSGSDGNYMLAQDGSGTNYKLVGNDDQLRKHVGHEVAITGQTTGAGTAASATDQGQTQPSAGTGDAATIQVTDVRMVANKCATAGSGAQSH